MHFAEIGVEFFGTEEFDVTVPDELIPSLNVFALS